jgi:hypothetical protein
MAQPNLEEIKEVSGLIGKIEQYKEMVETSKLQLEDTKRYFANQEQIEKKKILDDILQKKMLEELQQKITAYREEEVSQKANNFGQFEKVFDTYISSESFKSVIGEVIKSFDKDTMTVEVAEAYKSLITPGVQTKKALDGQLRIGDAQKEYILDPESLKKIVFDRLLVSQYTRNPK